MTQRIVSGSIEKIVAKCLCGGCGKPFEVEIPSDWQEDSGPHEELGPSVTILKPITAFDLALEAVRGGEQLKGPEPNGVAWSAFEGGHILCARCANLFADYWVDLRGDKINPTEDDVKTFFDERAGV